MSPAQHWSPCPWVSVRASEKEEEEADEAKEPFQRTWLATQRSQARREGEAAWVHMERTGKSSALEG